MSLNIKLENCKNGLEILEQVIMLQVKGMDYRTKNMEVHKMLLLDMGEKFCDYQWRIGNITGKHRKFSRTSGSERSDKNYKEECECGYIVTEWS